jgi:hypothetical protein
MGWENLTAITESPQSPEERQAFIQKIQQDQPEPKPAKNLKPSSFEERVKNDFTKNTAQRMQEVEDLDRRLR